MGNPEYLLIYSIDNGDYVAITLRDHKMFKAVPVGIGYQIEPFGFYKHVSDGEGILYKRDGE